MNVNVLGHVMMCDDHAACVCDVPTAAHNVNLHICKMGNAMVHCCDYDVTNLGDGLALGDPNGRLARGDRLAVW